MIQSCLNLSILFILIFFLSFILTGQFIRLASRRLWLDHPNNRSSHVVPTPRGGGVVIVFFILLLCITTYFIDFFDPALSVGLWLAVGLIALISGLDDYTNISARLRFFVHVLASLMAVYWLEGLPTVVFGSHVLELGLLGYIIATFALIWLLNLYNFMDGIDGLAASEALSVLCSSAFIIFIGGDNLPIDYFLLVIILVASIAGLLVFNWPPAKCFMGDIGSSFLGFVLGILALWSAHQELLSLWTWLILLAVFIVDATYTLMVRYLSGQKWYQAHRSHAYQKLAIGFNSHKMVTVSVVLINLFWLTPWAWLSVVYPPYAWVCWVVACGPLLVVVIRVNAGQTMTKSKSNRTPQC